MRATKVELLCLVAVLALVAKSSSKPPLKMPSSSQPVITQAVELLDLANSHPKMETKLSILGVSPGMSRAELEATRVFLDGEKGRLGTNVFRYALLAGTIGPRGVVRVEFDADNKVASVSGDSLELNATPLNSGFLGPSEVERLFGRPDRVGWAGYGECFERYAGYAYDDVGLTVTFVSSRGHFQLGEPWQLQDDSTQIGHYGPNLQSYLQGCERPAKPLGT